MSDQSSNSPNSPEKPYNEMAFDEFLKQIGNANIESWTILAEALGVDRKTIYLWRQHPLAQQAINTAIQKSLAEMEKSGANDWRMWREKAKILGVKDKTTLEHELGEGVAEILNELETDYDKLGQQAKGQMVAPNTPLQDKGQTGTDSKV